MTRFAESSVDEELLCPICSGVLENPRQSPDCEHAFCLSCIGQWISRQPTCPVDRLPIANRQVLKPVPRILRNMLARLEMRCENDGFGCTAVVKLDLMSGHLKECDFNPKKPVSCSKGCGLTVPKDEMESHNCIRELRTLMSAAEQKNSDLRKDLDEVKYELAEQRRDIGLLKEVIRKHNRGGADHVQGSAAAPAPAAAAAGAAPAAGAAVTVPPAAPSPPTGGAVAAMGEEVRLWCSSLPIARVTRWGGMISTPDAVLQTIIQTALTGSGCPDRLVSELMSNAHERRWPPGLLTLETRQMHRRQYEQYVCRRIPGRQAEAVAVMACENMHMSDDMILEPGLVMIFAHGVEQHTT